MFVPCNFGIPTCTLLMLYMYREDYIHTCTCNVCTMSGNTWINEEKCVIEWCCHCLLCMPNYRLTHLLPICYACLTIDSHLFVDLLFSHEAAHVCNLWIAWKPTCIFFRKKTRTVTQAFNCSVCACLVVVSLTAYWILSLCKSLWVNDYLIISSVFSYDWAWNSVFSMCTWLPCLFLESLSGAYIIISVKDNFLVVY